MKSEKKNNKVMPVKQADKDKTAAPDKKEILPGALTDTSKPASDKNADRRLKQPFNEHEPGKHPGSEIHKSYNPAIPEKDNEAQETDDQGNPVMKGLGKGL